MRVQELTTVLCETIQQPSFAFGVGFRALFFCVTFGLGLFSASNFLRHTEQPIDSEPAQDSNHKFEFQSERFSRVATRLASSVDRDCPEWSDEADNKQIIRKWLHGENLKNVLYDSKTGKVAKCFNPSNIMPTLIDVNNDGRRELALRSGCSVTGNCDMVIFERSGRRFRRIFKDVHGVHVFGLNETSNRGYYDLWATMHGSVDSGDLVVYRFDGKNYKPIRCFEYRYEHSNDGNGNSIFGNKRTLTPFNCSRFN